MYLNHYQLKLMPFEIGPDPKFLWLGDKHEEAFAILQYGILESKGFIVIIGEPGTGKSTLLNATVANFGTNVRFAKISDPALNEMDFFNFAANAFEMGRSFQNKSEFLIELGNLIKEAGAHSKKILLVIDEAQRLAPEMLEQIRVLSNVETPDQKVVSCIFAGQPEFLDMVKKNLALSQRIFLSHFIQPLTPSETGNYITHRLKIAGRNEPLFTTAAVQEVYRLTRGNPRLINVLCDQALLIGYSTYLKTIGSETIEESAKNTPIAMQFSIHAAATEEKTQTPGGPPLSEVAGDSAPGPSWVAPQAANTNARSRRTTYYATVALFLSMAGATFLYLNGWFHAVSMDSRKGTETHFRELQARFGELESEHQQLKAAEKHAMELETAFASKDQDLTSARNKLADFEEVLAHERNKGERLNAELSSRQAAIVEFQSKLDAARAVQLKLETDVQNIQSENVQLKALIQESKTEQLTSTAPPTPPGAATPIPLPEVSLEQADGVPDPSRVIDFVIKKKSR